MTSLDVDTHEAEPLMEELAPSEAATWSTETFLRFSSFRDAYRAWHETAGFFQWLESSDYAVTLLAASNLRPLRFITRERGPMPRASSSHDVGTRAVHLMLCAPCCNITVVLSEEERRALTKLARVFPFHVRLNGVATRKEGSNTAVVHTTELEWQHGIIAGLLARAHREDCAWRDRHAADAKGSETEDTAVPCARQILLGSASLCVTESTTVRCFCAALKLRSTGAETSTNAAARVRCLLPRGTPPSVVRQWMEETLAVLEPAPSAVGSEATSVAPRLRYSGSNANERILQLFFTPKKRPRPETISGGAVSEAGVTGEAVLQYMALLMSLYGYIAVSANDTRPVEAGTSDAEDAASGHEAVAARARSRRSPPLDGPQCDCPSTIRRPTDEGGGSRRTHRETVTQSEIMSDADTMRLLGWRLRCQFCACGPPIMAVREGVTTITTAAVTVTRTMESVCTPTGTTAPPSAHAFCEEARVALEEEAHALPLDRGMGGAVKCGRGASSSGGSEDVLGTLAEVEAALRSADRSQRSDQLESEVEAREEGDEDAVPNTTQLPPPARSSVDEENDDHEAESVYTGSEVDRSVGREEGVPAKAGSGDAFGSGAAPLDEQRTQMSMDVALSQAEATAPPVAAAADYTAVTSPPALNTATTKTVMRRATRSVTTITITFSKRPTLQEGSQQPRVDVATVGHHDSCPWSRLFLTDAIDATALAAPQRFMDFTWSVGTDSDAVGEESVTNGSNDASSSVPTPGEQAACDAHDAAGRASADGEGLLVEPRDPPPLAGKRSHRTILILRFLLPEVERLITAWRLSEEWERTQPSGYLRHPLWRTWLTSQTLHPVHTESADGVMEQYLRTLERHLMPPPCTAEEVEMCEAHPIAAANDRSRDRSVRRQPGAGTMVNAEREALGSLGRLCVTIGAPLYSSNFTSSSQTLGAAWDVATRSLHECFASGKRATGSGTAARSGEARRLLSEGLRSLLQVSGASAAQGATVGSEAGLKGAITSAANEESREREEGAAVCAFLRTVEARYADSISHEGGSNASRFGLALQREAVPRALHELASFLYPTMETRAADGTSPTEAPVYVVKVAPGSANASPSLGLSDADRSCVMQYLQGMHRIAQEEHLQLQRMREKRQEVPRLADAKATAAVRIPAPSAAAAAASTPSAPAGRAPPAHSNSGKGRGGQQQRSKGNKAPNSSPHQPQLPNEKQRPPVLQPPPSHGNSTVPSSYPSCPSSVSSVFPAELRHSRGPALPSLGYDNLPWASSQLFLQGSTEVSPPPQLSPALHQPHSMMVNNALHPMRASPKGQAGGTGPFDPPSNISLFPAPNVTPGTGQDPIFPGSSRGGRELARAGFADDDGTFFSAMHPFGWSPFPPGPSEGDSATSMTAALYARQPGAAPPSVRVGGPPPRGSDSVLGSVNASNLSSDSGSAAEDVRLSNWSNSSTSQIPAHGGGGSRGVSCQSASPVLRRDGAGGGNRRAGGAAAPSVLGAAAPLSAASQKASMPATSRARGSKQNLQPPAPNSQPSPKVRGGSPALGGGGSNVHAPPARIGGGGRSGQGRGRGGGQRRGGGGRGGVAGAGSGFRRGG
ncbi:hypothetical protein LSCM1_02752 [Leishmania martiniquensis]|uniref:Uncharacterized protein n=1 Tax=Leishmania martiniquensis TaxID=1580590 RepID=A0A836GA69_9TRYP|nr:hypothetical protein LSCM1_02752 [Leishmania martiniquensis]